MINRDKCTGCSACMNICPYSAITMEEDIGGFKYPKIDKEKCRHCGLCDKVCELTNCRPKTVPIRALGIKNKNEQIRATSTSGGAFYSMANYFLEQGGVVYGAAFDECWNVKHIRCSNAEQLKKLQRSKYVQSDLGSTFQDVESELKKGKKVLFSGTACQCSGLLSLLDVRKINRENLFTCDLVCHGVPSPQIWKEYVQFRERKCAIRNIDFRNKQKGWRDFRILLEYENGKRKTFRQNEDYFLVLFFHNYILRTCCHSCLYSQVERLTDFTLGDFWGIENVDPNFSDDKGISVIFANSKKGDSIIDAISNNYTMISTAIDSVVQGQPNLRRPTPQNSRANEFWNDYQNKRDFKYLIQKYADATVIGIIKRKYIFKALHYTGIFRLLLKLKNRE